MKTTIWTLTFLFMLGLGSCMVENEGPQGPQGQQGPKGDTGADGPQGPQGESGYVFEYEGINFTAPDYESLLYFPDDFTSLNSDVVLVYLLWDVVNIDGVDTEIWRQLPQNILTQSGTLQYNFDFSLVDVKLFMDASYDMSTLGANETDDWIARVVVVPGEFWNSGGRADKNIEYEDAVKLFNLKKLPTPVQAHTRPI